VCDANQCTRQSPLWRVFYGCGHSFHIECNLPDISVCKVCQEFLSTKAASLGKTANKAVHDVDLESDDHNSDEDDSDKEHNDSDDESSEDLEGESILNEATDIPNIENLISKVQAWHRFVGSAS